jgi:hypothetical protein
VQENGGDRAFEVCVICGGWDEGTN